MYWGFLTARLGIVADILPVSRSAGRHWRAVVLVLWGCLGVCVPSLDDRSANAVAADIRSTPHNLSRGGTKVEADEVCVFCHTPQIPVGQGVAAQPIWQQAVPSGHDFPMFDDIGRKQFGKAATGSQSVACLSCHDSNQAFGVMGGELDHPFGVPYRGFSRLAPGRPDLEQQKNQGNDDDEDGPKFRVAKAIKALDDFRQPSKGKVEGRTIWWVSSKGASTVRTRSDLPLYARKDEEGEGEIPFIECSSCHDPHVVRPLFLRVGNQGSMLCLTCHEK